jgi:hypothetical protein
MLLCFLIYVLIEKKKERENGDFVGFVNNKIASLFTVLEETKRTGEIFVLVVGGNPPHPPDPPDPSLSTCCCCCSCCCSSYCSCFLYCLLRCITSICCQREKKRLSLPGFENPRIVRTAVCFCS